MNFEEKVFENIDYTTIRFATGDYDLCRFINCNLHEVNLSLSRFVECEFVNCNLSMAKLGETVFNTVHFKACKMLGLDFRLANSALFTVSFEDCTLDFSSFQKKNLKKTIIKNCSLKQVEFIETDLTSAVLDNCDLADAKFERSVLEKADLTTAFNYSINPEVNKMKKAKFSLQGIHGLLDRHGIVITP